MFHSLAPTAFGLLAGIAFLAAPTAAKAQYYQPQTSVGFSIATPGFSLGIGNAPVYQPYPVVVPRPVYAPVPVYYGPRPVAPYWNQHRYHNHGPVYGPAYGSNYGPRGYHRPY